MISFKKLRINDKEFYKLYDQAYSWDKEHYCFKSKECSELLGLFSEFYALYENENFIGYGVLTLKIPININIRISESKLIEQEKRKETKESKINLAYIINPSYRNLGYGNKLVSYLIKQAESKEIFDLIEVSILKKNLASISLIEKQEFDFKYFDKEKIVFQKIIKK